ncbi:armadillo-type fold-containing protein [Nostoc sp. TCL26-01]|uniref:armadillo-type fold-containing protein n=1 Tax=Nostoc sp. TCL26-01 TaxID=2576904 RepID=UPI0015B8BFAD|nr:armadillo-type fold-containing protein [Nostoc sp. TCL26-01]QLE56804.1 armadillo-type fold-containing protein [Nostoc sp. TCL26-01]
MVKALSSWQQLINQILNWQLPELKTKAIKQPKLQRFSEPGGLLGLLTILVVMLLWNWKLLLALLMGIGMMLFVYSMQKWDWQKHWGEIHRFFHGTNRRLVIAVSSGGVATLSTYVAAAIWTESDSPWIAASAIAQGLGTLLTLILLVWQIVKFSSDREENHLEQLLLNLTAADALKRLITLRRLTRIIDTQQIDSVWQRDIQQCLQLLLTREEETVVRDAAFESLQALERISSQPSTPLPNLTPLSNKVKIKISHP